MVKELEADNNQLKGENNQLKNDNNSLRENMKNYKQEIIKLKRVNDGEQKILVPQNEMHLDFLQENVMIDNWVILFDALDLKLSKVKQIKLSETEQLSIKHSCILIDKMLKLNPESKKPPSQREELEVDIQKSSDRQNQKKK